MRKYFGTDGIRFIYNDDALNTVKRLANSLETLKINKIIIGNDTRATCEEIINIISTYTSKNINLLYVGEIATPGICYLSKENNCIGIMITASHNNHKYNGIKIFNKGYKLSDDNILSLEEKMSNISTFKEYNNKLISSLNLKEKYFTFLSRFCSSSKLKFAFDVSNGALSSYIKRFSNIININNQIINYHPDGFNINLDCGALYPKVVQKYVKENNLDYGFCYDGDADRMLLVDKENIYTGDQIMYFLCKHVSFKNKTLVITPYSNKGLITALSKINYNVSIVQPGDENILAYLLKNKLSIGGENAGHFILSDILPTGDGLLNSLILINLLEKYDIKISLQDYTTYPNKLTNIQLKNKNIINNSLINHYINLYKDIYKDELDLYIRFSGTENVLRLYVCHKENFVVNLISNKLITLLQILDNDLNVYDYESISIDEKTKFEKNVTIKGNTIIKNSKISNNVTIVSSVIEDSEIFENTTIGPFTHIHKDSIIGKDNRIGNFVEVKKSITGSNTKASHLSYIGDCIIGSNVNFGCGSIIVNYDGENKHTSVIKNNSFIGCNSNIISPVIIGENTFIAAGSTITKNIDDNAFVIARAKEVIKEDKAKEYPYYKKNKM